MRTCCICGTAHKTKKEDVIIYGCAMCCKGNHIVNTRNMPGNNGFEKSPYLEGKEVVVRVNAKLKEWKAQLQWGIK